ncbi:hypothetical protein K3N28_00075 [Glycomyces sp. TRM65418]|uniref:hypothetical protein n=1 Tax=Glycomyces sp. TRM65418 TaxID=2867006 RepID=UPI001CE6708F|nr:hypothetical protein [Glycomyces sp. TRM65418]MCC3761476.1 hypothetical protein [Glycomyces sp. TRM65418]QZD55575.1 hypothetical protein K3N28_00080 [Glycomyces sp. TRM65418]
MLNPTPHVIVWPGLGDIVPSRARVLRDAFRGQGYTLSLFCIATCDVVAEMTSTGAGEVSAAVGSTGGSSGFATADAEAFAADVASFIEHEHAAVSARR